MNYIGNACYHSTADRLLALGEANWLAQMKSHFKNVSPYPLTDQQVRAWGNSYRALASALASLPPEYGKLQLIFEYVLPLLAPGGEVREDDPIGVRADAILLAEDTACVLEFKDRGEPYPGCERQARKYANRLRRWHSGSIGMKKKTIVVLTQANELSEKRYRLALCSPDRLADSLCEIFPAPLHEFPDTKMTAWMTSPWDALRSKKRKKKKAPALKDEGGQPA